MPAGRPRPLKFRLAATDISEFTRGSGMSSGFGIEEARNYMHQLLKVMHRSGGSDLFIAADFPPICATVIDVSGLKVILRL